MSETQKLISPLEYMELSEFVDCKRQNFNRDISGEYLQYYSNLIKKEPPTVVNDEAEAVVSLVSGPIIQAKLVSGKDLTAKKLVIDGKRPKQGDKIRVKVVRRGGNIDYLVFKSSMK
jgi:hypothetical protein